MGVRVLIVDDEASILAAMAPLLRSRGYAVSTARSVAAAC
jgi:DNA-binding NtrC family response regulator